MIISPIEVVTLWSIQDAGLALFVFIFIIIFKFLFKSLFETDWHMPGSKISNAPVCF